MKIKVNLNRLSWCIEDSYWCPHAFMYLCRHAEISAIASNIVNELFWFSTSTQVSLYISAVYSQSGFKSLLSDHSLLPETVKQNVRIKILANDNLNILETRKEVKFNHCKKSFSGSYFPRADYKLRSEFPPVQIWDTFQLLVIDNFSQ